MTFWNRLKATFRKSDLDREIDEELAAHIDLLTQDNQRRGMNKEEAERAARVAVGNTESNKELHRDSRGLPLLDTLMQDLRYTFRTLRRDAGFTTFAILIVGLGIGASATVFSVVNTLLIRPLPFKNPQELAWVANQESAGLSGQTTQVDHMLDLRAQSKSFSDIGAYMAFYGTGDFKLTSDGEPERLSGVPVSQNFFSVLGVNPLMGRTFNDDEAKFNGPKVVMLSYNFWQRRFNGDPTVIGRKLIIDDNPTEVIGIVPESFDFGAIFAPGRRFELYTVFPLTSETNRWGNTMAMIGRLKPGATVESAQAETVILGKQFTQAHLKDRNNFGGIVSPLAQHVSGRIRPAILVMASAVGVVMLIVCANLSNLLLGRTAARQKEIAIRAALGAGRARLIRQMLTESLVLSFGGAAVGLILAFAGTRAIAHIPALSIPLLQDVHVDGFALAFTLLAALVTGVLFGMLPALNVSGFALHDSLKDAGRGSSQGTGHAWIRKALVVAEVAFACILLVGAGLLVRSFISVLDVNLGFRPESAATIRIDPDSRYKTQLQQNTYFTEALRLVRDIPNVGGAGLTDALPLGKNRTWGAGALGVNYPRGQYPFAYPRIVSDGFFQALGVPMRAGQDFTPNDTLGTEQVIIINETMARAVFPGVDPIGQRVANDKRLVVGVVGDVRHLALEQASGNEMYIPIRQTNDHWSVDLVVRSTLPPSELASRVREALRPIEPNLPSKEFRTLQTLIDTSVSPRRFLVMLLAGFAIFAVILASLGIYAVISYSVSQRTQEIGIRMALGASSSDLQRGILGETLTLAGVGMIVGIVGGFLASRSLQSLLFGVTSSDPLTFAAAFAVLLLVAAAAGYIPARRAALIDPTTALRSS